MGGGEKLKCPYCIPNSYSTSKLHRGAIKRHVIMNTAPAGSQISLFVKRRGPRDPGIVTISCDAFVAELKKRIMDEFHVQSAPDDVTLQLEEPAQPPRRLHGARTLREERVEDRAQITLNVPITVPTSRRHLAFNAAPSDSDSRRARVLRYSRQMLVPAFGAPTQDTLASLSVLIVGGGGLGCPVAMYLAGAGVGRITVVDGDTVDVSNLHRQVAHTEARCGTRKADSLCAAMRALNSRGCFDAIGEHLTVSNAAAIVAAADIVVDCTDNSGSRYLINDACVFAGVPLVSGAALGTDGQLSVYNHGGGPCYRCIFPVPPPRIVREGGSCSNAGVLGPVTGVIGSLQAMEVLKIASLMAAQKAHVHVAAHGGATNQPLRGNQPLHGGVGVLGNAQPFLSPFEGFAGGVLSGRMLVCDAADARFRVVRLRERAPACVICGPAPSLRCLEDSAAWFLSQGLEMAEAGAGSAPCLIAAPPASSSTASQRAVATTAAAAAAATFPPSRVIIMSSPSDIISNSVLLPTATSANDETPGLASISGVVERSATSPNSTISDTEAPVESPPASSFGVSTPSVSVVEFAAAYTHGQRAPALSRPIVLDCREPTQFGIAALPGSVSIPLRVILDESRSSWPVGDALGAFAAAGAAAVIPRVQGSVASQDTTAAAGGDDDNSTSSSRLDSADSITRLSSGDIIMAAYPAETEIGLSMGNSLPMVTPPAFTGPVHVICRRGQDSILATEALRLRGIDAYNVTGGLLEYAQIVDPEFPAF